MPKPPRRRFSRHNSARRTQRAVEPGPLTDATNKELNQSSLQLGERTIECEPEKSHLVDYVNNRAVFTRLMELQAEIHRLQMENEFLRKAVILHPGA